MRPPVVPAQTWHSDYLPDVQEPEMADSEETKSKVGDQAHAKPLR